MKNNCIYQIGPNHTLNMSWNWPNWEQLRALVYSVNSYYLRLNSHPHKVSVSVTLNFFLLIGWFVNKSNYADLPLREFLSLVHRISFLVIGNNIQLSLNTLNYRIWCSAKFPNNGPGNIWLLTIVSVVWMDLQGEGMFKYQCNNCQNFL